MARRTVRELVEETPRLTMSALRRAGLFCRGGPVVVDLAHADESVRVDLEPDASAVAILGLDGVQLVPLAWVKLRYGYAPSFQPENEARCTSLYLAQGRFGSRPAVRLAYVSQRMDIEELRLAKATERLEGAGGRTRVGGDRRARLLRVLKTDSERLSPQAWAQLDAAEASLRAKRRRRPLKSDRLKMEIWSADGGVLARQEVATLGGRRSGDLFLVCPVTGRRVLKLHLREGRFASAQAQRLR